MHIRRVHQLLSFLVVAIELAVPAVATDFDMCIASVRNGTFDSDGARDNHGDPVSYNNATAITYSLCNSACGAGPEPFSWAIFGSQFSSWLLPWLALVSQLPFGSQLQSDNAVSVFLAVGSPTLAAYSLILTVLNAKWVARTFSGIHYPNVDKAWQVLTNLQQSALYINDSGGLLASLVVLPENDEWWEELAHGLNYTQTWSVATIAQIAWVVVAYVFTVINSFEDITTAVNSNGQGVGSAFLWLLSIVIGWLQISPKCDYDRIYDAIRRANSRAYIATANGTAVLANTVTSLCAFTLNTYTDNVARRDETLNAPIYNYARYLPWVSDVEIVAAAFRAAADRAAIYTPVNRDSVWVVGSKGEVVNDNRRGNLEQVRCYTRPVAIHQNTRSTSGIATRFLTASALALFLQWGTIGGAVIVFWFTPTRGLGCRSGAYILYAVVSTIVWVFMVLSSFLSYYSSTVNSANTLSRTKTMCMHLVGRLATMLRRLGKVLAVLNSIWIILACIFQFSSFFDRCYCNSSVLGLGAGAYNVIIFTLQDIQTMKSAWIGAIVLSLGTAAVFEGFVYLNINPPMPRP